MYIFVTFLSFGAVLGFTNFATKISVKSNLGGPPSPPLLPQRVFFKELFKTEKCLEVPEMERRLTRKCVNQICHPPTPPQKKLPILSMGGQVEGQHVQTRSDDPHRCQWKLVQAVCVRCHRSMCPLLTSFFLFSLSAGIICSQKGQLQGSEILFFVKSTKKIKKGDPPAPQGGD